MTTGGVFSPLPWACGRVFHPTETPSLTAVYSNERDKEGYFPHSGSGLPSPQKH